MSVELPIEISVNDSKEILNSDQDILLLDCRHQEEYDLVHLENATLIPMDQLPQRLDEVQSARDLDRIIVYCHHGVRSLMVCQWLRAQGFDRSQSMSGGIDAWRQVVDPSLPAY